MRLDYFQSHVLTYILIGYELCALLLFTVRVIIVFIRYQVFY